MPLLYISGVDFENYSAVAQAIAGKGEVQPVGL